jgi:uncharacterized membrane protein YcaP (DUF421 family)
MIYPEVPILYAWLVVLVMVALNRLLDWIQVRSSSAGAFLEGRPRLLIANGEVDDRGLQAEGLSRDEFFGMLREREISHTGEVEYAFLEVSGNLGIVKHKGRPSDDLESTLPDLDLVRGRSRDQQKRA